MSDKHTPEPWVLDERQELSTNFYSDDATGSIIGGCPSYQLAPRSLEERQANARRIVACVNACRGLPTDELEQKGLVAAVGTELLKADDRAEAQEVEIRRLARVAAAAENELAGALDQRDRLLAALDKLSARGFFNESSCANAETNADMAEMRAAIAAARGAS